jgi:hypothetical protein
VKPHHTRVVERRVANDAFVDVDTVRYSVPHRLVREHVEVWIGGTELRVVFGGDVVAVHERSFEPHARVVDPEHHRGLWRAPDEPYQPGDQLAQLGRTLDVYAEVIAGGGS